MAIVKQRHRSSVLLHETKKDFLQKNWWVLLFVVACFLIYLNTTSEKHKLIMTLEEQLQGFKAEKEACQHEYEELLLQVNSQNDPAWIEMVLKKRLGLVPEDQVKVYFFDPNG